MVCMKFLRVRATVRCGDGMLRAKVRLRRLRVTRLLAPLVLPQLLVVSPALLLALIDRNFQNKQTKTAPSIIGPKYPDFSTFFPIFFHSFLDFSPFVHHLFPIFNDFQRLFPIARNFQNKQTKTAPSIIGPKYPDFSTFFPIFFHSFLDFSPFVHHLFPIFNDFQRLFPIALYKIVLLPVSQFQHGLHG